MSKATLTIEGFVAKAPELGNHNGKAVINVTVPHTPRRKNQQGQYEDAGPTLWVQASFWEKDAEAIAATVSKGTLVTITGQPELRVFQKQDGTTDAALSLKFGTLGIIPRAEHGGSGGRSQSQTGQSDGWGNQGAQNAAQPEPWTVSDVPF